MNRRLYTYTYIHVLLARISIHRHTEAEGERVRDVAYTRVYTYVRDVHEGAVYTKTQFVRSVRSFVPFVRRVYPRAYVHTDTRVHAHRITRDLCARVCARVSTCVRPARTYGFLHFMIYRAAFNGPQSVLKARRLIKEIIEDAK